MGHPTSILGLDGDNALTLRPEALSCPSLHLELVRNVLTKARYCQPALKVVSIHPECGSWSCTGEVPSAPMAPFPPPPQSPYFKDRWYLLLGPSHRSPGSQGYLHWASEAAPSSAAVSLGLGR